MHTSSPYGKCQGDASAKLEALLRQGVVCGETAKPRLVCRLATRFARRRSPMTDGIRQDGFAIVPKKAKEKQAQSVMSCTTMTI